MFYNDPELDDLLFSTGWKATLLRILKNFLFKEKDSLLYILTHFVVYKTNVDLEPDFKNCGQELSDLGLGNGFISFYLCDLYSFVARKIKCYYNSMCVTTL